KRGEKGGGKGNGSVGGGGRRGIGGGGPEREGGGRLHDHVALVQGRGAPCDKERRQQQAESELRWRERVAGTVLVESARRHQELRIADVRSGGQAARRREPLGRLWHSSVRDRLCGGRSLPADREICRRQEPDGS